MKVGLFTSFSPEVGGGAVILHTLQAHFRDCEVTWFHLGPPARDRAHCVSLGAPIIGGCLAADLIRTPAMWLGARRGAIDRIADRILAARCERHWVVAMDEGVMIGSQLVRRAPDVPLHVSIHDDQEFGMYGRSRRYRAMARLTRRPVRRLLKLARSVDVVSNEMGKYYRETIGLQTNVVGPVVAGEAPATLALSASRDPRRLTVGHIGAIYSAEELELMLAALQRAAKAIQRQPAAVFVGLLPRYREIVERSGIVAEMPERLAETEAVPQLARCDFMYAMYPFGPPSAVFMRTSLPTKLTTYVQVGRPVLAHAPSESTLVRTVERFGIGVVCTRNTTEALEQAIKITAATECPPARFGELRKTYYGVENAWRMEALLRLGLAT